MTIRTRRTIIGTGALAAALTTTLGSIAAPMASAADHAAKAKSGSFVGATSKANKYTPTTVTIKVANGKVTKVTVKVSPTDPASVVINKDSIPKLTAEAIAAQSAKVATVSGASLTSKAFIQSLQSALSKAGIKG